jgi:magnesium-transporting ATPase (P-type)
MSIILSHKSLPEHKLIFSKGADSVMLKRLHADEMKRGSYSETMGKIYELSRMGLRVLMFCYKLIKNS